MKYGIVAAVMNWEGTSIAELPDDVEALKTLVVEQAALLETREAELSEKQGLVEGQRTEIAELQKANWLLSEQMRLLKKWRFGRSSERWTEEDKKQLRLFDEAEATVVAERQEREEIRYTRRKKRRGRRAISKDIPRKEIVHELSEQERRCKNKSCARYEECEKLRPEISREWREELDFIPAQIRANRHVYVKYGEIECEEFEADESQPGVIEAPREKRIVSGGIVTPSLLSYIVVSKFGDALPFYRQQRIFRRLGVEISRQNMSVWTIRAASECGEYFELLSEAAREGPLINIDETPLVVLEKAREEGKRSKSYMWVRVATLGGGRRVVLYNYSANRSGEMMKRLLEGYRGAVQSDGYRVYEALGEREEIWDVGCMAHARRKFIEAWEGAGKKGLAGEGVEKIKEVYRIERQLREEGLSEEEFTRKRRRQAAPVLREFKRWMNATQKKVVPESLLGKALSYTQGQYRRLVRYLKFSYLTPDNNAAERAIRPFVIGRRNWLFNNTELGAHASATMYSLIETAKANNKDPFHFLHRLFRELPKAEGREDLKKLLPWNMEGIPAYAASLPKD